MKQVILQDTGFVEGLFPFRYLVFPLVPIGCWLANTLPYCRSWQGKHLSYAGQVELIKSVIFSMVHFWLSIFSLPDIVIKQIICICRNFLWTRNVLKSNSALVAWKVVCLPKKEGGLGLFDIKARNKSFLAKQL